MKAVLPRTTPAARVCLICIFVYMNTDGARQDGWHARLARALFRAVVEVVARCVVVHEVAAAGKYRWERGWSKAVLCLEREKSGRAIKLKSDQIISRHKTPGAHSGLLLRPGAASPHAGGGGEMPVHTRTGKRHCGLRLCPARWCPSMVRF